MRNWKAGVLAAAALAWAGGVRAAEAAKQQHESGSSAQSQQKQQGASRMNKAQGGQQAATTRQQEKKHPLFEGKSNFDVDGKIGQVSQNRITIQRNNLPAATLHVSRNTKIEVDGKQVSSRDLKRGQDVKASFNLSGDKPEAVEIKASRAKSQGQTGSKMGPPAKGSQQQGTQQK